ncbi:MAG: hypothetical protein O9972_31165 [Burkholderiales bacterium]|nr:hypothetical protein [Burkholderiales bacterium]
MSAAAIVGAAGRLDVSVAAKAFTGADGSRDVVLRDVVLRDLRLALASGCFGALIGSSGCGKTTARRMIAAPSWRYSVFNRVAYPRPSGKGAFFAPSLAAR